MSHIHPIGAINGQSLAVAQYQAYLERSRANRLAEQEEETRKKSRKRKLESQRENTDRDSSENPSQAPEQDEKTNPDHDNDSTTGFGNHYA